jgi:predicted HAD superfamily Cof-like phosphohydrolase
MGKIQKQVKEFMEKAGQKCPEKPQTISAADRILRVRLLLEEVFELAHASRVTIDNSRSMYGVSFEDFDIYAFGDEVDLVEVADALGDINYVSYGAANAYGIDMEPIEEEVQRSNMSKFIDGYRNEKTGKWEKGQSYTPVNLKPIIEKQQNAN